MAVQAKPLFGRYTDAELIGAGVTGEVFRATDSLLGRVVAVRVLAPCFNDDLTVRQRFIRETLAAAPVSAHPHTVTLYDAGDWEGQAYAVMDYLPGGSLEERLQQQGAQPSDRVIVWIDQLAATLDAAHEAGIAHGDVKPANLLLDEHGDVQLAEFGAAGALQLAHGSPAGDRYALGVVAFELLSGRRPTGTEPVSAANASLPRELDAVFATALAQDPTDRYGTCGELAAALRAAFANAAPITLIGALQAEPAAAPTPAAAHSVFHARRAGRAHLLWPLPALLALAALGAVIWAGLFHSGGTPDATQSAATPSRQAHTTSSGRKDGRPSGQIRQGIDEPGGVTLATKGPVAPSRIPASSTYGIHAGYCLGGQFLQLEYNQARSDPRYKGATFANFIAGQGLTCAQPPPGYVRHGFATSDLGVPPGVYPYYSSP